MQRFFTLFLLSFPLLGLTAPPAQQTVTLMDVINPDLGAWIDSDRFLDVAQLSGVGTAKGGAATTYEVAVVNTVIDTNAIGFFITTTETSHATLVEGSGGYTLSFATHIAIPYFGTGKAEILEECTFGGNCIDLLALPVGTATTTYSGAVRAFATITVAVGKNSAKQKYPLGYLGAVIGSILVGFFGCLTGV